MFVEPYTPPAFTQEGGEPPDQKTWEPKIGHLLKEYCVVHSVKSLREIQHDN